MLGADEVLAVLDRWGEGVRREQERLGLGAAEAAVGADLLLEGEDFALGGSYQELTMMSAVCGKEWVRRTASATPGPKSANGPCLSSSSATGSSTPCAPRTTPPCSSLRTRTKPTPGWLARVVSSAG